MIEVIVHNAHHSRRVAKRVVQQMVRGVLLRERRRAASVSVVFTDDRLSRRINRTYFRHDRPTDVMSFPLEVGAIEGEVYVNLDKAARQARTYGVSPQNGFGGSYIVYDFSTLPGRSGSYEDTLLPHAVISPYVTWTSDAETLGPLTNLRWGATFGGTYVGHTQQTVPGPIVYPAYVTLNASAFAQWDVWEAELNVNNLGDERYFTPGADTYANLSALPGVGRVFHVTLTRLF